MTSIQGVSEAAASAVRTAPVSDSSIAKLAAQLKGVEGKYGAFSRLKLLIKSFIPRFKAEAKVQLQFHALCQKLKSAYNGLQQPHPEINKAKIVSYYESLLRLVPKNSLVDAQAVQLAVSQELPKQFNPDHLMGLYTRSCLSDGHVLPSDQVIEFLRNFGKNQQDFRTLHPLGTAAEVRDAMIRGVVEAPGVLKSIAQVVVDCYQNYDNALKRQATPDEVAAMLNYFSQKLEKLVNGSEEILLNDLQAIQYEGISLADFVDTAQIEKRRLEIQELKQLQETILPLEEEKQALAGMVAELDARLQEPVAYTFRELLEHETTDFGGVLGEEFTHKKTRLTQLEQMIQLAHVKPELEAEKQEKDDDMILSIIRVERLKERCSQIEVDLKSCDSTAQAIQKELIVTNQRQEELWKTGDLETAGEEGRLRMDRYAEWKSLDKRKETLTSELENVKRVLSLAEMEKVVAVQQEHAINIELAEAQNQIQSRISDFKSHIEKLKQETIAVTGYQLMEMGITEMTALRDAFAQNYVIGKYRTRIAALQEKLDELNPEYTTQTLFEQATISQPRFSREQTLQMGLALGEKLFRREVQPWIGAIAMGKKVIGEFKVKAEKTFERNLRFNAEARSDLQGIVFNIPAVIAVEKLEADRFSKSQSIIGTPLHCD